MNYITTNIRIPEEDYYRLKEEAARQRKSLAGVIREKITPKKKREKSPEHLMRKIRVIAKQNAKYLKGWDSLKALREIRNEPSW